MKRAFSARLAVLTALSLSACSAQSTEGGTQMISNTEEKSFFDMEFHRGGRDARPKNTLYAYQYSLEYGASTIECDMLMSGDGVLVMSHNPVLNPEITVDAEPDGCFHTDAAAAVRTCSGFRKRGHPHEYRGEIIPRSPAWRSVRKTHGSRRYRPCVL